MSPVWCRTYLGLLGLSLSRNRSPGCLTNEKPPGPPTQTWDKLDLTWDKLDLPRNVRHHAGHMHLALPCLWPSKMLVIKFNIFLPWNLVKGDFMFFAYGLQRCLSWCYFSLLFSHHQLGRPTKWWFHKIISCAPKNNQIPLSSSTSAQICPASYSWHEQ